MVELAGQRGYASVTVARVLARANVSRSAFYKHFAGRDDCFLAALTALQQTLLAQLEQAVASQAPEHAARAAVGALLAFADSRPAAARFLMSEALAGGRAALDARDQGVDEIGRLVADRYQRIPTTTIVPDLPPAIVIGAVQRLLGARLRRGVREHGALLDDLVGWIDSYGMPLQELRWSTRALGPKPARSPLQPRVPLAAPARTRVQLSATRRAEDQRQRIVLATAEVVRREGYRAATVARIVELAGLHRRAFYELFADKEQALMAVQELSFRRAMAATAGAFFSAGSWPERVWRAGRTFTRFLEQNPTLARASLIESHAAGHAAVKGLEDRNLAFTIFLQEGYQHEPRLNEPPELALVAIAATNLETVYRQTRSCGNAAITRLLPHLTYICLGPFLGSAKANSLIDSQLEGEDEFAQRIKA